MVQVKEGEMSNGVIVSLLIIYWAFFLCVFIDR